MQRLKENNLVSSFRILANNVLPVVILLLLNIIVLWRSFFQGGQAASFGKSGIPIWHLKRKHSYEAGLMLCFQPCIEFGIFTYYYALTKDALFISRPFLHPVSLPTICLMSVK
jgi:hypothetical protein